MKAKIIIVIWAVSLMLMATDQILQAIIALGVFGISSWMLKRHEVEAAKEMKKLDNIIGKIIKY